MDVPKLLISYNDLRIADDEIINSYTKQMQWPEKRKTDATETKKQAYKFLVDLIEAVPLTFRNSKICFLSVEFNFQYKQVIKILDKYNIEYTSFIN